MKLQPVVAGQFYPGTSKSLQAALDRMEKELAVEPLKGEPAALLLPHAGYPYSGAVASLGYRSIPQDVETVVIVGPSHYLSFKGVSLFAGEAVLTPLGELAVDQEVCRFLTDFDGHIAEIPPAFAREHSVEVHFPLVQKYLPRAKVVPLVMGQGRAEAVKPLAEALLALRAKRKFLLVVSSDLSHYPKYETATQADRSFLEALLTGDEKKVDQTDEKIMAEGYPDYYCTHCGKEPVSTLLKFAKGVQAEKIQLLAYRNSGDVTKDHSRVVGYAAVAFCR